MAPTQAGDERRHPRRRLEPPLAATLHVVSSPPRRLAVDVLDISSGGLCLAMAPPRILGQGDRASLVIGQEFRTVQVRWVSPSGCLIVLGVSYALLPA